MKAAVRYHSPKGHARRIAEAIARGVGVEALDVTDPRAGLSEPVDFFFVGSDSKGLSLPDEMREYLQNLPEGLIDQAICFGCSSFTRRPAYLVQELVKRKAARIAPQAIWSRNAPREDFLEIVSQFAHTEVTRNEDDKRLDPKVYLFKELKLKEQREAAEAAAAAGEDVADEAEEAAAGALEAADGAEDAKADAEE